MEFLFSVPLCLVPKSTPTLWTGAKGENVLWSRRFPNTACLARFYTLLHPRGVKYTKTWKLSKLIHIFPHHCRVPYPHGHCLLFYKCRYKTCTLFLFRLMKSLFEQRTMICESTPKYITLYYIQFCPSVGLLFSIPLPLRMFYSISRHIFLLFLMFVLTDTPSIANSLTLCLKHIYINLTPRIQFLLLMFGCVTSDRKVIDMPRAIV